MNMIMQIDNFSLKNYNTFGIEAFTKHYFSYSEISELLQYLKSSWKSELPFFILGGGSNILFTKDYEGTIIHPQNKGITIISEDSNSILVEVGAGEIWDDFVNWAVSNNFYGAENLSLIPGNIGASPIQNIGAYGVEACDIIHEVKTIEIQTLRQKTFLNKECEFGYRNSIFKNKELNKHIVTSVIYKLHKNESFKIEYGSIQKELAKYNKITLSIVRETIISIRNEKLPNPKEFGNAGSYFKNPVICIEHYHSLKNEFPDIISYPINESFVKIAAGWLIEALGCKNMSVGGAKVHQKQALVIINSDNATSNEIQELAKKIQQKVFNETQIIIEPEVIYL
jgi:UDP-N-acetylmuramate dehydrogenase